QCVEVQQAGVGGVVGGLMAALGEAVGDQPVADVMGERVQDAAGLFVPSGHERQPLEADHRVAAPVGEPVVAGDHRPRLRVASAAVVGGAAGRDDDELVGGQHQQRADVVAGGRVGGRQQPLAA